MPGIRKAESARGQLQDPQPYRHKHLCLIVGADFKIGILQNPGRGLAHFCMLGKNDLAEHHKQRGRHPLAGHICHRKAQTVVIHEKEIIKIPADFPCRIHLGKKVEVLPVRKRREIGRQDGPLDSGRHAELGVCALLLSGNRCQFLGMLHDVVLHGLKFMIQVADLIVGTDGKLHDIVLRIGIADTAESPGRSSQQLHGPRHKMLTVMAAAVSIRTNAAQFIRNQWRSCTTSFISRSTQAMPTTLSVIGFFSGSQAVHSHPCSEW